MADKQRTSVAKQPKDTKSVTLVDAYTPITVRDQYGNPYICLNFYEASRIAGMMEIMQARGMNEFNTGDWCLDLPPKIQAWLTDLVATSPDTNNSSSNPQEGDNG